MLFAKQFLIGDIAPQSDQFRAVHSKADHTWVAMKELLFSQVAPTKHHTDVAFQNLCAVRHSLNQTVKLFGAYIYSTCKGTDITEYNKRMFC
jgi:hypothetical protein